MRALRPLLVPLVLLVAGCVAQEPAAPGRDAPGAPVASDVGPMTSGDPPTRTDLGHMPHMHDYWSGRERVTLFDGEVPAGDGGDPFVWLVRVPEGQVGAVPWRLPDGEVVMEGTGQMDLTASWDDPLVSSLAVTYRTGPNAEWSAPLALPAGKTASIAIAPAMTDMPHMTASRWEFAFHPAESPGTLMGPFDLRVEIVKLRDIMLFPGHPELFHGLPEKTLHDREHAHEEASYAKRVPSLVTQGEFGEKTVAPDALVPMETLAMRVELDIIETSASPGEVAEIRFFYRAADTSYLGHPAVLPLEGSLEEGRVVYQFPVEPAQTDPPYADASQWLFFIEPATKFTGAEQEPTAGGATDVSIKYRLKIIAYDHPLDAYSKMEGDE